MMMLPGSKLLTATGHEFGGWWSDKFCVGEFKVPL